MATISLTKLPAAQRFTRPLPQARREQTDEARIHAKRDAEAFAATVEVPRCAANTSRRHSAGSRRRAGTGMAGPSARAHEAMRLPVLRERVARACRAPVGRTAHRGPTFLRRSSMGVELSAKRGPVIVQTAHIGAGADPRRCGAGPAAGGEPGARGEAPAARPRRNIYLTRRPAPPARRSSPGGIAHWCCCSASAGLRWGEAAALRVSDIDFLRRRIELHRNAVTVGQPDIRRHLSRQEPHGGAGGVRRRRARADCRGQGPRRADVAVSRPAGTSATVVGTRVMAVWGGGSLPESRPDVPAGDRARVAAYRGVAGDQRRART